MNALMCVTRTIRPTASHSKRNRVPFMSPIGNENEICIWWVVNQRIHTDHFVRSPLMQRHMLEVARKTAKKRNRRIFVAFDPSWGHSRWMQMRNVCSIWDFPARTTKDQDSDDLTERSDEIPCGCSRRHINFSATTTFTAAAIFSTQLTHFNKILSQIRSPLTRRN